MIPLTEQEGMWKRQVNFNLNSSTLSFKEDGLMELVNQSMEVKQHMGQGWTHIPCCLPARYWNVYVYILFTEYCWTTVQDIVRHCNGYKDGENKSSSYSQEAYSPVESMKRNTSCLKIQLRPLTEVQSNAKLHPYFLSTQHWEIWYYSKTGDTPERDIKMPADW